MERVDDFDAGFGWIADEFMQRCSHALLAGGHTWLIDPLDAAYVESVANAAGVIQLLDRHNRDCATLAARLGVPHHVVPDEPIGPFEFLPIRMRRSWREVALWWPERGVLVVADALGTAGYFCARGERLGVHPFLRLRPPKLTVQPDVILCGHGRGIFGDAQGAGIFGDAQGALGEALRTSRRRMPEQFVNAVREWRAHRPG
jgi:hypothetical protein